MSESSENPLGQVRRVVTFVDAKTGISDAIFNEKVPPTAGKVPWKATVRFP